MTLEESVEFERALAQERLIFGTTEAICDALEERQVTRRELAARLEISPGEVTQRLNGNRNLTLKTVADMFNALGFDVSLEVRDRREGWSRAQVLDQRRAGPAWNWPGRYTSTGQKLQVCPPAGIPAA